MWLQNIVIYKLVYREEHSRVHDGFDITLARFDLMAQSERYPAGVRMGEISHRLPVTSGNVTQLADQLEKEELVERTADPHSQRAGLGRLTVKGRKASNAIAAEHEDWIINVFSGLNHQEKKLSLSLLSKEQSFLTKGGRWRRTVSGLTVTEEVVGSGLTSAHKPAYRVRAQSVQTCKGMEMEDIMSYRDQPLDLERRTFLGGATLAGVASLLAPSAAVAQTSATAALQSTSTAVTTLTAEHLVGGAVNYAYAVKAGPFVFLNGHEGFDFAAGVVPSVEGATGFPEFGKPGLRREADFMFDRMGQVLKSLGTDLAHSVRLDQYYTEADAVRAYHLARFAALGKYVPPSTSIITTRCFGGKSTMNTSLVAVMPDPQWEIKGVYPERSNISPFSGYAPAVVTNDFVFAAGTGPDEKDVLDTDPPQGPHHRWGSVLPIRRQAESALKRVEDTLKASGTSLSNCLKAQVHIAGEENIPDFLDVWNEHVGASPCALTVTPAKGFASLEMILEINYILLKDGAQRKKEIIRADIPEMASYSPAVRGGEFIFSPGLLPLGRDGKVAGLLQGDNFPGLCLRSQLQANTIFDHAETIAKAAGTSMRNAVRIDYWVSDISEFPGVVLAWAGRYGSAPHPFACVVTPKLPAPGATVMADFWFHTG